MEPQSIEMFMFLCIRMLSSMLEARTMLQLLQANYYFLVDWLSSAFYAWHFTLCFRIFKEKQKCILLEEQQQRYNKYIWNSFKMNFWLGMYHPSHYLHSLDRDIRNLQFICEPGEDLCSKFDFSSLGLATFFSSLKGTTRASSFPPPMT